MATSVVPSLIDAMVTAFDAALSTVQVYDGYGVSDDPGDFLMIGVDQLDPSGQATAATVQQDWANANYTSRSEQGDIACAAVSWNGDAGNAGQKSARDAVYATQAAVETVLRNNPSLGVANVLWTSFGTNAQLSQDQDHKGSLALLTFSIFFRAQI